MANIIIKSKNETLKAARRDKTGLVLWTERSKPKQSLTKTSVY